MTRRLWRRSRVGAGRYRYNGKELNQELGLYGYGARWYDAAIARWTSVDPLADHPNQIMISPYHYAANNPILHNDLDGKCPPWVCGAISGAGVEFVAQVGTNIALGNDPFDIDYYDVFQSGVIRGLTGRLSILQAGVKTTRVAAVALVVTDELAKAGTDVTIENGEVSVASVANGSKSGSDAAVEAVVGLAFGTVVDKLGAVAGDLINTTARSEANAATRQIRMTRDGSKNNVAAHNDLKNANSTMTTNTNKANGTSTVVFDMLKAPVENGIKEMFNSHTGNN